MWLKQGILDSSILSFLQFFDLGTYSFRIIGKEIKKKFIENIEKIDSVK